jgi:hypothetical protein
MPPPVFKPGVTNLHDWAECALALNMTLHICMLIFNTLLPFFFKNTFDSTPHNHFVCRDNQTNEKPKRMRLLLLEGLQFHDWAACEA